ncbi:predicted protein [Candida tropicalis MYA-3404]|uniref:SP-RING-type domain-containing protein n=1 Tax=Candida tropicalis (strain ATCC MYA-3404 / T1) TaxID=294747 RepID=C5MEG0_CANTT|nr:predicted protein [Candida tropicalis MYA-3404]EER31670.1 predicted protein [Candida tropicalis MYA-3404]KAG4405249.1 hypothetical protein JTP64_005285 [Candida tropicalis]
MVRLPSYTEEDIHRCRMALKQIRIHELRAILSSLRIGNKGNKQELLHNLLIYFDQGVQKNDQIRLHAIGHLVMLSQRNRDSKIVNNLPDFKEVYDRMKISDPTIINEYFALLNTVGKGSKPSRPPPPVPRLMSRCIPEDFEPHPLKGIAVSFKQNPFYKFKYEIHVSPQQIPKDKNEISFILNKDELRYLRQPGYKLYMVSHVPGSLGRTKFHNVEFDYPFKVQIFLNDQQVPHLSDTLPVDLTDYLHKDSKLNHITLEYNSADDPNLYLIHLCIVKKYSYKKLLAEVINKPQIPKQITIKKHKAGLSDGILLSTIAYDLKDPLSGQKMKYPAQGMYCDHVTCFDAADFLKYISENEFKLQCSCCLKPIALEDLRLVEYFKDIVDNTPNNVESVNVDLDGNWTTSDKEVIDVSDDDTTMNISYNIKRENSGSKKLVQIQEDEPSEVEDIMVVMDGEVENVNISEDNEEDEEEDEEEEEEDYQEDYEDGEDDREPNQVFNTRSRVEQQQHNSDDNSDDDSDEIVSIDGLEFDEQSIQESEDIQQNNESNDDASSVTSEITNFRSSNIVSPQSRTMQQNIDGHESDDSNLSNELPERDTTGHKRKASAEHPSPEIVVINSDNSAAGSPIDKAISHSLEPVENPILSNEYDDLQPPVEISTPRVTKSVAQSPLENSTVGVNDDYRSPSHSPTVGEITEVNETLPSPVPPRTARRSTSAELNNSINGKTKFPVLDYDPEEIKRLKEENLQLLNEIRTRRRENDIDKKELELEYRRKVSDLESELFQVKLQQKQKEILEKEKELQRREEELLQRQHQFQEGLGSRNGMHQQQSFLPQYSSGYNSQMIPYTSSTALVVQQPAAATNDISSMNKTELLNKISEYEKLKQEKFSELSQLVSIIEKEKDEALDNFNRETESMLRGYTNERDILGFVARRNKHKEQIKQSFMNELNHQFSESDRELQSIQNSIKEMNDMLERHSYDKENYHSLQRAIEMPIQQQEQRPHDPLIEFRNPGISQNRKNPLEMGFNTKRQKISNDMFKFS